MPGLPVHQSALAGPRASGRRGDGELVIRRNHAVQPRLVLLLRALIIAKPFGVRLQIEPVNSHFSVAFFCSTDSDTVGCEDGNARRRISFKLRRTMGTCSSWSSSSSGHGASYAERYVRTARSNGLGNASAMHGPADTSA